MFRNKTLNDSDECVNYLLQWQFQIAIYKHKHKGLYSSAISTSLSRVTKTRYCHSNYHLIGIILIPSDSNEADLYVPDIVLTYRASYLGYLIHKTPSRRIRMTNVVLFYKIDL